MSRSLPIELGILMKLAKATILKQRDLHKLNHELSEDYHIYIICRRPRVSIIPTSFKLIAGIVDVDFKVQIQDTFEIYNLKVQSPTGYEYLEINSTYPYSKFELLDVDSKEVVVEAESSLFIQSLPRYYTRANFLDLEVLYIGQAFGNDGDRNASERLTNHSTLQYIYSESIQNNPDCEIWLVLADLEEINIAFFSPTPFSSGDAFTKKEIDDDRLRHPVISNFMSGEGNISAQQKINFTEAALIKYFSPPYNKIYRNSFPNPSHKSYSECYDLQVNSIAIEMDIMATFNIEMYSESISRKPNHMFHFTFHTKEEKRSMFEVIPGMPMDDLQNPWKAETE